MFLRQSEGACSLLPWQDLHDNGGKQMDHGYPVYNFPRVVRRRNLRVHLVCTEPEWIFPLHPIHVRAPELTKWFSAANVPTIPLGLYHTCLADGERGFTIVRMPLSLSFGRYFVTFNPSVPCIDPHGRSCTHQSFRSRYRTNPNNQSEVS